MAEILAILKLLLDIISRAGGPEAIKSWLMKHETAMAELQSLADGLEDAEPPRRTNGNHD